VGGYCYGNKSIDGVWMTHLWNVLLMVYVHSSLNGRFHLS